MDHHRPPPSNFELTDRTVHVWALCTRAPDAVVEKFQLFLMPDETARAARFRFEHLQRSFILTRGALRVLLGRYLNTAPRDLQFSYGSNGKPTLAPSACLQFNASHSGDLALFAFTTDCEIGIDVEAVHPMPNIEDIASR